MKNHCFVLVVEIKPVRSGHVVIMGTRCFCTAMQLWYNPLMAIYKYTCQDCGQKIERNIKPYRIENFPPKFCDNKCYLSDLSKSKEASKKKLECDYCNKAFLRRLANVKKTFNFCSRECKEKAQSVSGGKKFKNMRPDHYADGKFIYRNRAFSYYGEKCQRCRYDKCSSALQVHHIDRNRKNNEIENLEVVCRNCHAEEHFCV